MENFFLGLIMYICIVPAALILYVLLYPRNWKKKARIFGVNNRPEFLEEKSAEHIDGIVRSHHRQATVMLVCTLVITTALLFVPVLTVKMIAWTIFVYVFLLAFAVPYALGNSEIKKYKKVLGIVSEKVLYADLKNAGNIHALNVRGLVAANLVGLILFILAVLCDVELLPLKAVMNSGMFLSTGFAGMFFFTSLVLAPIAVLIDRSKNQIISENSDINANYNRARKKVFGDYTIALTWVNNAAAFITLLILAQVRSEAATLVILTLYLLAIMLFTGKLVKDSIAVEKRYVNGEAKLLEDDDDYWILGMFYYNPGDMHLNVPKRAGVGMTINMAHPAGKAITAISILVILGSLISLIGSVILW